MRPRVSPDGERSPLERLIELDRLEAELRERGGSTEELLELRERYGPFDPHDYVEAAAWYAAEYPIPDPREQL